MLADDEIRRIADAVAASLFTDGRGIRASRLVMEFPGETLKQGGLCQAAARDEIEDIFRAELTRDPELRRLLAERARG